MSKKIIVVDDSSVIRTHVTLVLSSVGYKVIEAGNGSEGLKRIDEHGDVAMVISDINMPQMSGIEMLTQLKSGKYAAIPVIMLTTEGNLELMARAKRAGAKAWMVKPFRDDLLIETVGKIVGPA